MERSVRVLVEAEDVAEGVEDAGGDFRGVDAEGLDDGAAGKDYFFECGATLSTLI